MLYELNFVNSEFKITVLALINQIDYFYILIVIIYDPDAA